MDRHVELGYQLSAVTALSSDRIYYQPGPNVEMKYPCIVYENSNANRLTANNKTYIINDCYNVTHIYKNLSNKKTHEILNGFDKVSADRLGDVIDGYYHDYYTIYF